MRLRWQSVWSRLASRFLFHLTEVNNVAHRHSSFIRFDPSERSALLYFCPPVCALFTLSNKISYHLGGSFSLVEFSFGAIQSHLPLTRTNFCVPFDNVYQSNCTSCSSGTFVQPCTCSRTDSARPNKMPWLSTNGSGYVCVLGLFMSF